MSKTKKQKKYLKRTKIQNKKLLKKYPFLYPYNVWTGKLDKNYDYSYIWIMDNGWKKLQIDLCNELRPLLIKSNYLHKYRIYEIKEKYGMLRWTDNGFPNKYWKDYCNIINKYESISQEICIMCGKSAKMCNVSGWISPYCNNCMKKIHNHYNAYRKEPIVFNYKDYICC